MAHGLNEGTQQTLGQALSVQLTLVRYLIMILNERFVENVK
jgi:hypothetical protein